MGAVQLMAADWIKMRGNLWDDPRVAALCDACDCGEAQVIGALYWLWATADQHTEDGLMPGLTIRQIDRKTGVPGFGNALEKIGWIEVLDAGVALARFEEHNGASAKRRAADAQRKAGVRNVSASDADKSQTDSGSDDDKTRRTAELEKEEEKEKNSSSLRSEEVARKRVTTAPAPGDVDAQVWADWLALRKAKKAPVTETVIDGARREAAKAGMTFEAFLRVWCQRGSQGLQADWLKPHERAGPSAGRLDRQLETAALLTGSRRPQPKPIEAVDVESRTVPAITA